jgi:hypothetical protein
MGEQFTALYRQNDKVSLNFDSSDNDEEDVEEEPLRSEVRSSLSSHMKDKMIQLSAQTKKSYKYTQHKR